MMAMINRNPASAKSSGQTVRWLISLLTLVALALVGIWELLRVRAHYPHVILIFLALLVSGVVMLVSEFLTSREALTESHISHDRLRKALLAGKSVAWDLDVKAGNDELFGDLRTMFGISSETCTWQTGHFYRFVHPEDRRQVAEAVARAQAEHIPYTSEFRVLHEDGTKRWVSASGEFQYNKRGEAVRMLGVAVDITERKQVQESLVVSEAKFAKAFCSSPIALTLTSALDNRYIEVNETFEQATGWKRDEVIGRTPFDIGIWVDPREREELVKLVLDQKGYRSVEVRYRRKDGSEGVALGSGELVEVAGEPCILSAIVVITDRKRAEEALRTKEAELKEAQSLAHLGNWELSFEEESDVESGKFNMRWSEEMYRIHGLDPSQPVPNLNELFRPESWQTVQSAMVTAVKSGSVPDLDLEVLRPDGSTRWVNTRGEVRRDSSGRITGFRGTTQDITDRKLAEEALHRKEHDLAAAQQLAHMGSWECDADGRVMYWSEEMYRIYGLDPSEPAPTFEELQKLYTPGTWNRVLHAMETRSFPDMDMELVRPDGTRRWIRTRFDVTRKADGTIVKFRGISRDITEEKQTADQLRESERRFRRVVEHIGDALIADDIEGRIVFANDRFLKLFGFSREELPKLGFKNYIAPEYRDQLTDRHHRRIRGENVPSHFEYEGLRADGTRMWLEVDVLAVTDNEGRIVGTQSAIRNITERKRAEQAIQQSEQRLRHLIESSNDWVYEMDQTGAYTYAGPQCRELLGYEPEELLGKRPTDFMPPEEAERHAKILQRNLGERKSFSGLQSTRVRKDGHLVVWETNGVPVFDAKGDFCGYRGLVRDITERHRAEMELRESEERFRRVVEHIGDALVVDDIAGRIVFANDQFLRLFGFGGEELGDLKIEDYVAPNYRTELRERHTRRMSGKPLGNRYEFQGIRRDGNLLWIEAEVVSVKDGEGKVVGSQRVLRDITEQKHATQAILESEQRLSHVISSSNDWVWEVDTNGVYTYAGPQCRDILGYEPEEILGKTPFSLMPPDEALRVASIFNPLAAERKGFRGLRNVNLHKDGRLVVLETNGVPILDSDGNLCGYRGIDRDVTERDRAEQALRESEERLRHLITSSNDWVWEVDANTVYIYASPQCLAVLGYEPAEILGKTPYDLMPEEEASRVASAVGEITAEGKPFFGLRKVHRHKDGRLVVLEANGIPIVDAEGNLRGYRGMCRDITERDRAEQAMRESEERFRLVANTAPVMIWMNDTDDQCTYVNKRWLEFTGRRIEEELGEGWLQAVHPDDVESCLETSRAAFRTRSTVELQYRLRRHDGAYRWVLDLGVPRFNADGSFAGYIGSCIDVTERKQAEEELTTIGRRLIEAHEEERTWIGRELHDDINQRLALVSVELDHWLKDHPSRAPVRDMVHHAQERITEIARDVQRLSHRLHSSKLDYLGLAKAASSFCRELSQRSNIEVTFTDENVPRILPKEISLCLFRVLQEALQNAVKHSGVKAFNVRFRGSPEWVELTVEDNGSGFDPAEAFTHHGIGLISMRERLQLVKGELTVHSKPGSGTRIHARVPLQEPLTEAMAG